MKKPTPKSPSRKPRSPQSDMLTKPIACFASGSPNTGVTEKGKTIVITGQKAEWLRKFNGQASAGLSAGMSQTLEHLIAGCLYASGREAEPQEVTIKIREGTPLARLMFVTQELAPGVPLCDLLQGWLEELGAEYCAQPENLMLPSRDGVQFHRNRLVGEVGRQVIAERAAQ